MQCGFVIDGMQSNLMLFWPIGNQNSAKSITINHSQFSEIHWPLNITELVSKGIHNASYLHLELIIEGNISWRNLDDMQVIENISSKIYGGSECRIYPHQLRKEGTSVFFSTRQIDSWTTKTVCIKTLFNHACIKLSIKHEIELPMDAFELISATNAWFFSMINSLVFTHFSPHNTLQARLWFPNPPWPLFTSNLISQFYSPINTYCFKEKEQKRSRS